MDIRNKFCKTPSFKLYKQLNITDKAFLYLYINALLNSTSVSYNKKKVKVFLQYYKKDSDQHEGYYYSKTENNNEYVFVYGTLLQGLHNHYLLKNSKYIGKGITIRKYSMYDYGDFPGVNEFPKKYYIYGEIYQVSSKTLKKLDELEGIPDFYYRKEIKVKLINTDTVINAFTYFNDSIEGYEIPTGNYMDTKNNIYYFAFGSNMNLERMKDRMGEENVPILEEKLGILPNYELVFNKKAQNRWGVGYANIVKKNGSFVEGIVYKIPKKGLDILDIHEGVSGGHYIRKEIEVLVDGQPVKTIAYIAGKIYIKKYLKPTKNYLGHLLKGKRLLSNEYYKKLQKTNINK